ncbi:MAG: ribosomal-processing cysteine protease Prp [Lachnospiraceae bacterium]|nr:ribosomal-processing cysteine protease Prp [Lachnospiraceae bacterium]
MTKIYVKADPPVYAISFRDHATGAPEVCSGISALMYSLEGFLINHEEEITFHVSSIPEDNTDAFAYIRFDSSSEKVNGAFELIVIGLLQIQESYPDFCKVITI